jgi:hypothetical protein
MTPEEAIAAAEAMVDKNLPLGWSKKFVTPPWFDRVPACRGCGKDPVVARAVEPGLRWTGVFNRPPTVLSVRDGRTRTLWYSFAMLCEHCCNKPTLDRLAVEVFAPQSPEAGMPEVTIETTDPSKPS